ncbi:hypothetical protein [Streptomyces sp. CS62]|uniref:hypothetical protein n=1 Tax=Streptomyces sp. CS62 TaxID=3119268 RepID=UPI002F920F8A
MLTPRSSIASSRAMASWSTSALRPPPGWEVSTSVSHPAASSAMAALVALSAAMNSTPSRPPAGAGRSS